MKSFTFLSLVPFPPPCSPKANTIMFWCVSIFYRFYCVDIYTSTDSVGYCFSNFKIYLNCVTLYLLTTCFSLINIVLLRTVHVGVYAQSSLLCSIPSQQYKVVHLLLYIQSFPIFCYCDKAARHIHIYPSCGTDMRDFLFCFFKVIYLKLVFSAIFYCIFPKCFPKQLQ